MRVLVPKDSDVDVKGDAYTKISETNEHVIVDVSDKLGEDLVQNHNALQSIDEA